MQVGDILRCKKEMRSDDDNTILLRKGYKYSINRCNNNNPLVNDERNDTVGFLIGENNKHTEYYLWNYFEKKIDRVKRIINEFEKR